MVQPRKRISVPSPPSELAPPEIKRIREKLGLSQVEAGELLGGGPRAFTKYESGKIKPAAAVVSVLRLLDANPGALATLAGPKVSPVEHHDTGLFEVSEKHIGALTDRKFTTLMRRLLGAEAQSGQLPMDGIHVAANITTGDGGEDGRIEWTGGPHRTRYLPSRLSQFQLKATKITPAEAGRELLTTGGELKPMVRTALEEGGTYIMVCSRPYNRQEASSRVARMLKILADQGLAVEPERVQFRDASQLAQWANSFPSVSAWVLEQTQPGLVGPFRDWTHWAGRFEHHSSPWVQDTRLEFFRAWLRERITPAQGVARVVGLSGIGKSRLTLEALGANQEEEASGILLSSLVLNAVEFESGPIAIKAAVQSLADTGVRAVVAVDRCIKETHDHLAAFVKRAGSRLSLVTIDHELPRRALPDGTLLVQQADKAVVEALVSQAAPNLPRDDHDRLVRFSSGFPQMARVLVQAWLTDGSIASASNDELVDRIVLGRVPFDQQLLKDAAMLLGAFGLVGVKAPLDELPVLAGLSRNNRTGDDLRAATEDLTLRGVAQYRGRLVTLQPRPVALALAEQQWRQWSLARWEEVLLGSLPKKLRWNAARQLALLNDRPIALEVARHLCRPDGKFATLSGLQQEGNAEILSCLAEVDAKLVVLLLERLLAPLSVGEVDAIAGDVRRQIVWALEKIAFHADTFERGALLLFKLALAENEQWGNNATGQFKGLFPALSGSTAADGSSRLRVLDELLEQDAPLQMPLVVEALAQGASPRGHSRMIGPEIQGSRPAIEHRRPKFWKDYWDYIISCTDRLVALGKRSDEVGKQARTTVGHELRTLISHGLICEVERWTNEITKSHQYWSEALDSLGDILQYDRKDLPQDVETRVRALVAKLVPQTLLDRTQYLLTDMPWDFPGDVSLDFADRGRHQVQAVEELTSDLLKEPDTILALLSGLSVGQHRMVFAFGESLAKLAKDPLDWMEPIMSAFSTAPEQQRNCGMLVGYFKQLAVTHRSIVNEFKQSAVQSKVYSVPLVVLSASMGIKEDDVQLVREGLRTGVIPAHALSYWVADNNFSKLSVSTVSALLNELLVLNDVSYSVAITLMGTYAHDGSEQLNDLRAQLKLAADNVHVRRKKPGSQLDAFHFERLMTWHLEKGAPDTDAKAVAISLAKTLAHHPDSDSDDFIAPLLSKLLSEFGVIVWPVLSQVIGTNRKQAWKLEHLLADKYASRDEKRPPLLSLPEDILFGWCHAQPTIGPAFVARIAPVLTTENPNSPSHLHPMVRRLLDEFGDQEDVLGELAANMHTFAWSGSLTTYFALYQEPLRLLLTHPIGRVRRWAQGMLTEMGAPDRRCAGE